MCTSGNDNSVKTRNDTSKKKVASAQNLFMKPLLRLKQQEHILEKGLISAIKNMKIDSNLLQDITHQHAELSLRRHNYLDTMYKNMENIISDLDSVKNIVKNPEEIKKLDVNVYKSKLIKLSQNMQDFKKSYPIESLKEEGDALNVEFQECNFNFDKYEKNATTRGPLSCKTKTENKKKEKIEFKDVDDFHSLVAITGHTENWTLDDHLFFLKTRKKCKSIPTLVTTIRKKCPDLTAETIVNHEAWYKHYEDLRERQRMAVKEWRQRKESERKAKNIDEIGRETERCREKEDLQDEIVEEKAIKVFKNAKPTRSETNSSASSNNNNNNDEKKELIKRWKIEKENKRFVDEEQMRVRMKLKREREEDRRKKRREKIQESLEEYKKKKSMENSLKEMNKVQRERCKYNTTLIKAFREQDKEYTEKRKNLILRSKKPKKSDLVDVKRVELVETRNYSTLLSSTKVWREKCKTMDDDSTRLNNTNEFRYIKDIPRMCIRWRNEESEDLNV
ncbi:coiled-coil domain-containing protein [Apis mellifera caucasica]|nr:coiled-coil domain-containing protein [Apis mellifera caucasica]